MQQGVLILAVVDCIEPGGLDWRGEETNVPVVTVWLAGAGRGDVVMVIVVVVIVVAVRCAGGRGNGYGGGSWGGGGLGDAGGAVPVWSS